MEGLGLVITAVRLLALLLSPLAPAHHCCDKDTDEEEKEKSKNDSSDNPDPHRDTVGLRKGKGLHVDGDGRPKGVKKEPFSVPLLRHADQCAVRVIDACSVLDR